MSSEDFWNDLDEIVECVQGRKSVDWSRSK